jgi:DNA-binding transcriptional LysR family regulator
MDLNLVRTFLEVCQTRHFGQAAERLHLTGSAVGARIKTLEEQLGVTLFMRMRHGIELTPTAERLISQFRNLLSTWDQVRFLVSVESAPQPNLIVAASSGVWFSSDSLWIRRLLSSHEQLRLKLETQTSAETFRGLQQGSIDLGVTLEQPSWPEIVSRQVSELHLELMSDTPGRTVKEALNADYVHVDWSTSFSSQFLGVYPDYITSRVTVSNAGLAAKLLWDFPGTAYLSRGIIERLRPAVPLVRVEGAATFRIPVFASYPSWSTKLASIEQAIEQLADGSFD